ncbi:hypothetical protein [Bifidobacterium simiarum]|uniref:hypothetical protein n=1 Tax=Bifidobacterium simiarum TaxID=2045441 RepID=UPI001BDC3347|nr:hypothetical protein [Bifidobacterium simiarum]MBT1167020.1 hypothetical protein [Bifidobacterium simiarum]
MAHTSTYRVGEYRKSSLGKRGKSGGRGERRGSASGAWGKLCALFGLISVAVAVAVAAKGIAPETIPVIKDLPLDSLLIASGALIVVTIVLIVGARLRAKASGGRTRSTVWGVFAVVLSLLFSGCGLAVNTMFSDGLVTKPVRDEAPVTNAAAMRKGVESAYGACPGGWKPADASSYPGVKSIELCVNTRTAYATFENKSAVSVYRAPLQSKALELLETHSGEAAGSDWATLTGTTWVVVGKKQPAQKLSKAWGGTVEDLATVRK